MTANQINKNRQKLVKDLMFWSIRNGHKMTTTDKKICHSKITDYFLTIGACLITGSFLRRTLFRIEFPFLEMAMQDRLFNAKWIKSVFSYSVAATLIVYSSAKIMREDYLVDLAL